MEALSPGIFAFPVFLFILLALIIFAFFRLFKYLVQFIRLTPRKALFVNRYLPVTELAVWTIFFIWAIQYLFNRGYLVTLVPLLVFLIIILYLAWYGLKDIIAGVIFKTTNPLQVKDHVTVAGITGKVTAISQSSLEIEDYSGHIVNVPFSKVVGNIVLKHYPSQSLLSHNFLLQCPLTEAGSNIFELSENLRTTILALPWASQKKEPKISVEAEGTEHILLNITIFSLDQSYFIKTEKFLEKEFGGQVVKKEAGMA